jgi:hypothetical protein
LWPDLEETTWTVENLRQVRAQLKPYRNNDLSDIRELAPLVQDSPKIARLIVDLAGIWSLLKSRPGDSIGTGLIALVDAASESGNQAPDLSAILQATESSESVGINLSPTESALKDELLLTLCLTDDIKRKGVKPLTSNTWSSFASNLTHDYPGAIDAVAQLKHLVYPDEFEPLSSRDKQ